MKKTLYILLLLLTACSPGTPAIPTALPTLTPYPIQESAPTAISHPTETPPASAEPEPTNPYWPYTIQYLRTRPYPHPDDSEGLEITEDLGEFEAFSRVSVQYPSDGLAITGL
jgi:hypothetical protein